MQDSSAYYTNGDYGQPQTIDGMGPGWNSATDGTFDTGVLIVSGRETACLWLVAED